MYFYERKWFIALAILVPNLLIAVIQSGSNLIFAIGAALGAATVVYLFYIVCRTLLQKTKLKRACIVPLALLGAYAIYYAYMNLF